MASGDRPMAVADRRRITRPGQRRAVNRAVTGVRCPGCNRSGSLRREAGQAGGCWNCGGVFDLQPVFELRKSWDIARPPYWRCVVQPVPIRSHQEATR